LRTDIFGYALPTFYLIIKGMISKKEYKILIVRPDYFLDNKSNLIISQFNLPS